MPDDIRPLQPGMSVRSATSRTALGPSAPIQTRTLAPTGSVGGYLSAIWYRSPLIRNTEDLLENLGFASDPDFELTPELRREFGKGLPENWHDEFDEAVSERHALYIRQRLQRVMRADERLGRSGLVLGMGGRFAAEMLDPVDIAVTAAASFFTGGTGGALSLATKLRNVGAFTRAGVRIAEAGVAVGATTASTELLRSSFDKTVEPEDIVYAGVAGVVLGGGTRSVIESVNGLRKALEYDAIRIPLSRGELVATARGVRDMASIRRQAAKGYAAAFDQLDLPDAAAFRRDLSENTELIDEQIRGLSQGEKAPPVPGAVEDALLNADLDGFATPSQARGLKGLSRVSISGQLRRSPSDFIRRLSPLLDEDVLPADGQAVPLSGMEWVRMIDKHYATRHQRVLLPQVRAWMRQVQAGSGLSKHQLQLSFEDEAGKAIRRDPGTYTTDPHINTVADHARTQFASLLRLGQKYGIPSFENIPENARYLPRLHDQAIIRKFDGILEDGQLEHLYAAAIRSGFTKAITPEDALFLAKRYLRRVRDIDNYTDLDKERVFSANSSEQLRLALEDLQVPEELAERILKAVEPPLRGVEPGTPPRAMRRIDMDETLRVQLKTREGGTVDLAVEDLLVNNVSQLLRRYAQQVSGHAAFHRIMRAVDPEKPPATREQLMRRVEAEGRKQKDRFAPLINLTRREFAAVDVLSRQLLGLPLDDTVSDEMRQVLETMRAYQHARVMGQVGFAQIADTGLVVGESNWRAMVQQMPMLNRLLSRAKTGELTGEFLDETELLHAVATDRLRGQVTDYIDPDSRAIDLASGKLRHSLNRARRLVNDLSGLHLMNQLNQRSFALFEQQGMFNLALARKRPSDARLRLMGLTPQMWERIADQMRKHVHTRESSLVKGQTVRGVRIDRWDDHQAASAFVTAIDKRIRQVIQEVSLSQLPLSGTGEFGRTFLQFRTFMIAAWEKQAGRNMHARDAAAFLSMSWQMLFGGLGYVAQSYLRAIGRSDREQYIEERLSTEAIARAAFQRAAFSSFLPNIADTTGGFLGFDPLFDTRASGFKSNVLDFPAANFLSNVSDLPFRAGEIRKDLTSSERDFSQSDVRSITQLLAFQNWLPLVITQDFITSSLGLPEKDPPRPRKD